MFKSNAQGAEKEAATAANIDSGQQLLIMMLGVPGAGKSYFARNIAELLGAKRIAADEVRTRLFGDINIGRTPENHRRAYEVVNEEMAEALQRGESVVRDNQNNHRKDRDMCRTVAQGVGAWAVVVWVQTPREVAVQRCMERPATEDQLRLDEVTANEFYERSMRAIQAPSPDEDVIRVDGVDEFEKQLAVFFEALARREP